MKSKLAYAIVYKKRPSINLNEIYSKEQIKDCFVEKDEMVEEVVIVPKRQFAAMLISTVVKTKK